MNTRGIHEARDAERIDAAWWREATDRSVTTIKHAEDVAPHLRARARELIAKKLQSEAPIEATLPEVARKLYDLASHPDASFDQIARVAANDPDVAAHLIHLANTSFYQRERPVETIRDAVFRVGLVALKTMLILPALQKRLVHDETSTALWRHSRVMAAVSPFVAALAGVRPDPAMLAGLLHDVGRIFLWLELGKDRLLGPFVHDIGDVLHESVGAELSRRWKLPDAIVFAVGHHHEPAVDACTTEAERLAHVICVGDRLVRGHELGRTVDPDSIPSTAALGIPARPLVALSNRIDKLEMEAR